MTARLTRFRRVIFIGLACYWCAIFIATHFPAAGLPDLPHGSDKVAHFTVYAGLSYLLALCYLASRPMKLQHYLTVFIVTAVYAAADEILQKYVGRDCEFFDGVADSLGSLVGLGAFALTRHLFERSVDRVAD